MSSSLLLLVAEGSTFPTFSEFSGPLGNIQKLLFLTTNWFLTVLFIPKPETSSHGDYQYALATASIHEPKLQLQWSTDKTLALLQSMFRVLLLHCTARKWTAVDTHRGAPQTKTEHGNMVGAEFCTCFCLLLLLLKGKERMFPDSYGGTSKKQVSE